MPPPRRYDPFVEIDQRLGGYAELAWRSTQFGSVSLVYYDNRADPSDYHPFGQDDELFAWRTRFTSAGAQTGIDNLVFIAQAIAGTTEIAPTGFRSETHFSAGYLLAGWNLGAWRPALRFDAFTTLQDPASPLSEHGHAFTAALNWRPLDWLRLTGEMLRIDSSRDQRIALGLAPRQIDTQVQFNAADILFTDATSRVASNPSTAAHGLDFCPEKLVKATSVCALSYAHDLPRPSLHIVSAFPPRRRGQISSEIDTAQGAAAAGRASIGDVVMRDACAR